MEISPNEKRVLRNYVRGEPLFVGRNSTMTFLAAQKATEGLMEKKLLGRDKRGNIVVSDEGKAVDRFVADEDARIKAAAEEVRAVREAQEEEEAYKEAGPTIDEIALAISMLTSLQRKILLRKIGVAV